VWALNEYAKTKTVCFDAVYVSIANKYYATGQADWVEKEQLEKIIDNAKALSKILCGQKAPDIKARAESYATPSLYKVTSKYTAVFIWDADCGHCKSEAKELKKVYSAYKDKGFTVYSVEVGGDKNKWQKFSDDEGIGWINLQQTVINTDVKKEYDVKTTPQLFLLDENKAIVYKRIGALQLVEILGNLIN
jgi:peroxiredoxin